MLMRSSSTPLLNSWAPHTKESSPEPESLPQIPRTRYITMSLSSSGSFSPIDSDSAPRSLTRAVSESDLRSMSVIHKKKPLRKIPGGPSLEEVETESEYGNAGEGSGIGSIGGMFVGTGMDNLCGAGGGSSGSGGGGSNGGDGGGYGDSWEYNRGNESTDAYYQKMLKADPGNSLLLSNYAKFLKEFRGDYAKAEEYCGRAILATPNDGNVLSMYGDLIWQRHKDAERAETYFDQAVKAVPNDCYVMASYAKFLWDSEEDEEEEEVEDESMKKTTVSSHVFQVAAAAS